jgi:hypothetical protein
VSLWALRVCTAREHTAFTNAIYSLLRGEREEEEGEGSGKRKREEGRRKREEGRGKRKEGRGKRKEERRKRKEGRGKREEGRGKGKSRREGRVRHTFTASKLAKALLASTKKFNCLSNSFPKSNFFKKAFNKTPISLFWSSKLEKDKCQQIVKKFKKNNPKLYILRKFRGNIKFAYFGNPHARIL